MASSSDAIEPVPHQIGRRREHSGRLRIKEHTMFVNKPQAYHGGTTSSY
jgi:hypothetical protein